jgi:dihydrofolate synthase/folylpolyglutamate synthase
MNYSQSIKYLESFQKRGMRFGLQRMDSILKVLGDPQSDFQSVHIAGTNGKGSVAAMLSSILTKAGYKTGLYTSPHLVDYTERVRINDKDISRQKFADAVEEVKRAIDKLSHNDLTEFEVLTAVAYLLMAKENVEIAIIEVGLGGRMDATNVITPILSVITNIDYDHMDVLGNSIAQIAAEKSGIIKNNVPVVVGPTKGIDTIINIAKERHAMLISAKTIRSIKPPLEGEHQLTNTFVAVAAIKELRELGFDINDRMIAKGLKSVRWQGRLQILGKNPLMILDGAHNPAGAKALASYLSRYRKKFTFIIGMQKNKDIASYIKILKPLADRFYVVKSTNPGAIEKEELATIIGQKAVVAKDIRSALRSAQAHKSPICITGSLYLVGDYLGKKS